VSKIMPEHLDRAAFVYVRQSTAYQVVNNLESQRRQYGHDNLAGTTFRLSMMTSANPAAGQRGRVLRSCWRLSARAEWGRLCHLKLHVWHGTAVIGTRYRSSAASSEH
jgi:hypothetical protein